MGTFRIAEDASLCWTGYQMSYDEFIQELAKGMTGQIIGYTNTDNDNACLIYLKSLKHRILVPAETIETKRAELILALRCKINEGLNGTALLVLKDDG